MRTRALTRRMIMRTRLFLTFGAITGVVIAVPATGADEQAATDTKDKTPPTVQLTAPAATATLSGASSLAATASDDVGVTKVEFYRDKSLIGTATSSPYRLRVDTTKVPNGTYSVTAKAYDAANNSATSRAVDLTVSNAAAGIPGVVGPPPPPSPPPPSPPPPSPPPPSPPPPSPPPPSPPPPSPPPPSPPPPFAASAFAAFAASAFAASAFAASAFAASAFAASRHPRLRHPRLRHPRLRPRPRRKTPPSAARRATTRPGRGSNARPGRRSPSRTRAGTATGPCRATERCRSRSYRSRREPGMTPGRSRSIRAASAVRAPMSTSSSTFVAAARAAGRVMARTRSRPGRIRGTSASRARSTVGAARPGAHQDSIQIQGGTNITFVNVLAGGDYDAGTSTCMGAGGGPFYSLNRIANVDILGGKYISCNHALNGNNATRDPATTCGMPASARVARATRIALASLSLRPASTPGRSLR